MRFRLDPERSMLHIHASSSIHPIETATSVSGWLELGDRDEVSAEIELSLAAMRSGNPLIDRAADRNLDVRRHPTVRGVLTELAPGEPDGTRHGTGDLMFHGHTHPISGEVRIEITPDGVHVTGAAELDVTEWGVQPPSLLVVKVHKEVRVELDAVGHPDG
jgi:polyisoprenoid-binding protein YceI